MRLPLTILLILQESCFILAFEDALIHLVDDLEKEQFGHFSKSCHLIIQQELLRESEGPLNWQRPVHILKGNYTPQVLTVPQVHAV